MEGVTEGNRVSNQADLSLRLGCSHIALKKWLANPEYAQGRPTRESNGTYLVDRYQKWTEFHGLEGRESQDEFELSSSMQLKDQLLEIKIQQERAKLEKIKGEQIERDLVSEVYGKCVATIFRELDRVFGDEIPPRTRGLTEKQQSALNREELRIVFKRAKGQFEEGIIE